MRGVAEVHGLPDDFGENGDAKTFLEMYLSILGDAVERWRMDEERSLVIAFPPGAGTVEIEFESKQ